MSGVKKIEHAVLEVTDLDEAVEFYTDVVGLVELERADDVVYLGCGLDENYDLGLVEGQTGVEHFALRVTADELEEYETRLDDAGVETERVSDEPGQTDGLRFSLPSDVEMELVTVADSSYHHPVKPEGDRNAVTPRDLDHINLMTHDADADLEFLEEHLDFAVSDKIVGESGFTIQAWLRHGRFHHDVGLSNGNDVVRTLHHLAFQMDSFDHMKKFCDRLASKGHRLELGPSRHNAGGNLFAYFWAPGGNRIELTAEMATVDPDAETGIREIDRETNTVSTWGGVVPTKEFLEEGS
ncbi:VOC family protein [Natrialba sp. INN-245]|uniref:VOC family protein n=1 Tax=Natrialba sp. INN-245 TaxID=2690967 RepID=UPI001312437A|nr:VOC family protein [Natrialba sp. INN-245]MWV38457.1 catechol 1,2-dioxygenase [Natrialba sp. INN-245]